MWVAYVMMPLCASSSRTGASSGCSKLIDISTSLMLAPPWDSMSMKLENSSQSIVSSLFASMRMKSFFSASSSLPSSVCKVPLNAAANSSWFSRPALPFTAFSKVSLILMRTSLFTLSFCNKGSVPFLACCAFHFWYPGFCAWLGDEGCCCTTKSSPTPPGRALPRPESLASMGPGLFPIPVWGREGACCSISCCWCCCSCFWLRRRCPWAESCRRGVLIEEPAVAGRASWPGSRFHRLSFSSPSFFIGTWV
mmetsp:Transcript_1516/g.3673  ORF Transcript_1516/g.3673 Transcript_1516/m.3673 type:complete len:252 (+) Transcript_1516:2244-2999(+)